MDQEITTKKSIYNLEFWRVCTSSFLFFMSFNMIIPELPDYLTSLGGEEYKGLIISLFTLTAGLSRPFSGKLTDKIGRVPVMIFGVLVCFICGITYPVLATVEGFLLLRFFHGFSTGFKPTGTSAFLADIVPFQRRGEAMGVMGFFASSGMGIGPVVGSFLTAKFNLDTMFYISAFTALLSIIIILGMQETLEKKEKFKLSLLRISSHEIIERQVLPAGIVMLLTTTAYGTILTLIPDMSKHIGIQYKGLFFLFFTAASMMVRIFAGKFSDQYGRIIVLRASTFLMSFALGMIALSTTPFALFSAAAILGLAVGMTSPTIYAWTIDMSHPERRGRGLSTMYIAMEIGIGLGAIGSAYIFDNNFENISLSFWITSLSAGLAFLFLLTRKRDKGTLTHNRKMYD